LRSKARRAPIPPNTYTSMARRIIIRCPVAYRTVATDFIIENATIGDVQRERPQFRCPVCGQLHRWGEVYWYLARSREERTPPQAQALRRRT